MATGHIVPPPLHCPNHEGKRKQHDRSVSSSLVLVVTSVVLPSTLSLVIAAGAGGGLVASIATCPLDVVKTKLQAQRAVDGQKGYQGIAGEGFC